MITRRRLIQNFVGMLLIILIGALTISSASAQTVPLPVPAAPDATLLNVLMHDDFNGPLTWAVQRGTASLAGGWVVTKGSTPGTRDSVILNQPNAPWTNYTFRTHFIAEGGGNNWYNAMLYFRVKNLYGWDQGTFYRLVIFTPSFSANYGPRLQLTRTVNNNLVLLSEVIPGAGIVNNQENMAAVTIIGNNIRVTINDTEVMNITDPSPISNGGVGLGAIWESKTRFDYADVTEMRDPAILLHDDFNGPLNWQGQRGMASINNGWVITQGSTPGTRDSVILNQPNAPWTNYSFKTHFFAEGGGNNWYNAQLYFRVQNMTGWGNGTYYNMNITTPLWSYAPDANRIWLGRHNGTSNFTLADFHPESGIIHNQDNIVTITVIGANIRVAINDIVVINVTDPNPIPNGGVGLGAMWESKTRFDYADVTEKIKPDILFHDDFNGPLAWTIQRGNAWIDNGWVITQGSTPGTRDSVILSQPNASWTDYTFKTRFYAEGGGSNWYNGQIYFRVQSMTGPGNGTYYSVGITTPLWSYTPDANRVMLIRHNGTSAVILADLHPAPGVVKPQDNTVKVKVILSRIRVFINEAEVINLIDPSPIPNGGVGIGAVWESRTRFDYADVTEISNGISGVELLANRGFEISTYGTYDANYWLRVNPSEDIRRCNNSGQPPLALDGQCFFQFKGSTTENSEVRQDIFTVPVSSLHASDRLTLTGYVNASGPGIDSRVRVIIKYTNPDLQDLLVIPVKTNTGGWQVLAAQSLVLNGDPVSIRVILSNNGKDSIVRYDAMSLQWETSDVRIKQVVPLPEILPLPEASGLTNRASR